jgi:hypothetical protein
MKMKPSLLYRHSVLSVIKIYSYLSLWPAAFRCIGTALRYFFALQYWGAFLNSRVNLFWRRIPVSRVDCALDGLVPFKPEYITTYMDFATHWIRTQGFLLEQYGARALPLVREYIDSISALYVAAAGVYRVNLSTTERPRYLGKPQFISVHILDPHLLCIPSLHVMVAARTYTTFRAIVGELGGSERYAGEVAGVYKRAVEIAESVLYVKQHSVNCVSAALYAMGRLDGKLFPESEAGRFIDSLFENSAFSLEERAQLRGHIRELWKSFLEEGRGEKDWREPLLRFLRERRLRQEPVRKSV